MTPIPLEKIGFRVKDHKSVLWWLGLLYRRPAQLEEALRNLSRGKTIRVGGTLYIHFLPYIVHY